MSLSRRLDRLERAEPDSTVRPDWGALSRGDIEAWLASLPEQPPEKPSDPVEDEIRRVREQRSEGH